ncbi:MAG TPA: GNAT family N-acetyltransferase [Thermoplasmata archaeon]|nr:GNAT family N-acetyltransferase [Thermoplasmata archaeon]
MESDRSERAIEAALDAERQFVLTLGGFALEVAGASLVTHEKLPVPRFNFVQERGVGRERQAAFFEHALDHYFQRALRPTFRIPRPVPDHIDSGLRRFGFRPREQPLELLLSENRTDLAGPSEVEVAVARPSELDLVASFWTSERERPEFRSALEIAWAHPHPSEQLVPLLARIAADVVSAALVYRYRSTAGIHAVATRETARGRGAASALVAFALGSAVAGPVDDYSIFADSPRLERRLESLGFRPARSFTEYELPRTAELSLPPPGPPSGPKWRPPRTHA